MARRYESPQINTGNPAFPFPQFLEYDHGKSLAANNAHGVTHADMEKAMREGYKIMMRRALTVPSRTLDGTPYIVYNHTTVPQGYGTFVSEGDGYALLAAAYFADKKTFDGLWLWIHDNRFSAVKKYYDCADLRPNYTYGSGFAGWECDENTDISSTNINSAADGDVDIALALLMAHKQWGDDMGVTDACGNMISYRDEAMKMITNLVDTLYYDVSPLGAQAGIKGYLTGIVGVDGYQKSGNTWGEVTNWRTSPANTAYPWAQAKPDPIQVNSKFVDYIAPSYFHQFAEFLEENGGTEWQISQCKRCEASSDWTMGDMYAKGYISSAGNYTMNDDGSVTTYGPFAAGEDFRLSWRTHLNYVWHGNPDSTWNPVTHQIEPGGNTFEYDMALRHKEFLKYPHGLTNTSASAFCSKLGASPDPGQPNWKGVAQIKQQYSVDGQVLANYGVNWSAGTGMPAAVASEDLDLLAELYRQCELAWDDQSGLAKMPSPEERYILSTPKYFHGWFRLLGMLTATGNLHAPKDMVAAANMKVYMDVNKTFVYERDQLDYEVSYRNYGAVAANGVEITTTIDDQYEIVSISDGGVLNGNTITWNIGTVPGFKTGGLEATRGKRSFTVKVKEVTEANIVCLTSTITSTNAEPWTSNEYPNNESYTMERNCVDLLKDRVLAIKKTTDRPKMNPNDIVNFTLDFENKTGSNLWLDGGRDGVILSYANYHPNNGTSFYQFYRIWHTAQEAYINLGNYRVSYFMNDGAAIGLYDPTTNPTGWDTYVDNQSDLDKYGYNPLTLPKDEQLGFTYQRIPWGEDANGAWNQRMITKFANVLSAPSTHVFDKLDSEYLIHKGVVGPGFTRTRYESKPSSNLGPRILDDWSYDPIAQSSNIDGQGDYFYPVTPTYTDATIDFAPVEVDNYSKDACGGPVKTFRKVLFEEFDGYTWRRVAGNGPLPGRETYNVVVVDSIPIELKFKEFTDDEAVDVKATYTALTGNPKFSGIVKWEIPVMLTGEKGNISYSTIAQDPPCPAPDKKFINAAWISSEVDSPDSSSVELMVTCNPVPPTPPKSNSLTKTADKVNVEENDNIVYTLNFTNKDGTEAAWEGAATDPSDWQTLGSGLLPDMNKSTLSLDQNNNTAKGTYAFGHKKSHGINGWAEASILKGNSSPLSMIFRHSAGTPGQNDFKGLRLEIIPNPYGDNTVTLEVFNNTSSVAKFTQITYPGSTNPMNVRVQLIDDVMYIFINNFDGAPLKVVKGLTQLSAGYVGLYGSNTQQKLSGFSTGFDSAFDLVLSDQLPTELDVPSTISDGGTLAGGKITWPTIPGPILADQVIERTFETTINTCANFITNIGQADVYGISGILAQYVVNCASDDCVPPTDVQLSADKLATCSDSIITLTASAVGATYHYALYDANGIVEAASPANTFEVNVAGTYHVVVTDPVDPVLCTANTDEVEITIYERPDLSVTPPTAVCAPNTVDITTVWADANATGGTVSYHHASPTSLTNVISNATVLDTSGKYYVLVDNNGCADTSEIEVTINPLPVIESINNTEVCSGIASISDTITTDIADASISWTASATGGLVGFATSGNSGIIPSEIVTNNSGTDQLIKYSIVASKDGCSTMPYEYQLTVFSAPKLSVTPPAGVCLPATVDITTSWSDENATGGTVTYHHASPADNTNEINNANAIDTSGTYFILINNKGCTDEIGIVANISSPPVINVIIDKEVCSEIATISDTATSDIANADFSWTASATGGLTGFTTTGNTAIIPSETITNTTGNDQSIKYSIVASKEGCASKPLDYTITIHAAPALPVIVGNDKVCQGDTISYSVSNNTSSTYSWAISGTGLIVDTANNTSNKLQVIVGIADYRVSVAETNGTACVSQTANLDVDVQQLAIPASVGDDADICTADDIILSGSDPSPGTGVWTLGSGTSGVLISDLVNPSSATTKVNNMIGGDVIEAIWTVSNGVCPSTSDSYTITGASIASPTINLSVTAGSKPVYCVGDEITLTAVSTGGGSNPLYTYYDGVDSELRAKDTDETFTIILDQDTSIYVELRSNSSCLPVRHDSTEVSQKLNFIVDIPPSKSVAGKSDTICTSDYTLNANVPNSGTGTWKLISGAVTITSPSKNNTDITGIVKGDPVTLAWVIKSENEACPQEESEIVILRAGDMTSAKGGDDLVICSSDNAPLLTGNIPDNSKNPPETSLWRNSGLATISASGQTGNLQLGANKFAYVIDNGICPSSIDTVIVFVEDLPSSAAVFDEKGILQTNDFEVLACSKTTDLLAQLPSKGIGSWSKVSVDNVDETIDNASGTIGLTDLETNFTQIQWTVESDSGACPSEKLVVSVKTIGDITSPTITLNGINTTDYSYKDKLYKGIGQKTNLCLDEVYTLSGPKLKANETMTWSYSSGDVILSDQGNNQKIELSGTGTGNTVTLSISSSTLPDCNANTFTLNLDVFDKPAKPSVTPTNLNLCGGESQELVPVSAQADIFEWAVPFVLGGFNKEITSANDPNTVFEAAKVSTDQTGDLSLLAQNECGYSEELLIPIDIKALPNPAISLQGNTTESCIGSDISISVQSQNDEGNTPSYSWKVNGNNQTETGLSLLLNEQTVSPIFIEVFMVSNAICIEKLFSDEFKDTISIHLQTPSIDIVGGHIETDVVSIDNDYICSDTSILYYEAEGNLIETKKTKWYISNGVTENFIAEDDRINLLDFVNPEDLIEGNILKAYPESVAGLNCPVLEATSITIDVIQRPMPSIEGQNFICSSDQNNGKTLKAIGGSSDNDIVSKYSWLQKGILIGEDHQLQIFRGGEYNLSISNSAVKDSTRTCAASTNSPFEITPFFYGDDSVWIEKEEYFIDLFTGNESSVLVQGSEYDKAGYDTIWQGPYLNWSFIADENGDAIITEKNSSKPRVEPSESGTLYYTVSYGPCTDEATTYIKVLNDIYIPEVYTPNGDGQFDTWEIKGLIDYTDAEVKVYNRWGGVVFESIGYPSNWNGTSLEKDVPDAVYYYVIDLNRNNLEPLSGSVTIIR